MSILIKEHFNRWYSLKMYYTAVTLIDIPVSVSLGLVAKTFINFFQISDSVLFHIHSNNLLDDGSTDGIGPNYHVLHD